MRERLDERDVASEPFEQFGRWFEEAVTAQVRVVNAMTLATANASGAPSARIVLLKSFDSQGFVFFTDYSSRKGQELEQNPRAALLLFWSELEREVRIEGAVGRTPAEESDAYFTSRPVGSRLAALSSNQSRVVANRQALEHAYAETEARYGAEPPRPVRWGGYRVIPHTIEFWQGRPNRLHDRLLYTRENSAWRIARLSP